MGRFTVAERSMQAFDAVRNRSFPCDMWWGRDKPTLILAADTEVCLRSGLCTWGCVARNLKSPTPLIRSIPAGSRIGSRKVCRCGDRVQLGFEIFESGQAMVSSMNGSDFQVARFIACSAAP